LLEELGVERKLEVASIMGRKFMMQGDVLAVEVT
jgi:hypothetical protein